MSAPFLYKDYQLEQRIAEKLWYKSLPSTELDMSITVGSYARTLKSHRKHIGNVIRHLLLRPAVKSRVLLFLELFHQLHVDAFAWAFVYLQNSRDSHIFNSMFNESEHLHHIRNFITINGRFDDHQFVRQVIADDGMNVDFRYNLASLYCLDKDINEFQRRFPSLPPAVASFLLDSNYYDCFEDRVLQALVVAMRDDREHVVDYLWAMLSTEKQESLIYRFDASFNVVYDMMNVTSTKMLEFWFDMLPERIRNDLMRLDFARNRRQSSHVLSTFLSARCDSRRVIRLLYDYGSKEVVPCHVLSNVLLQLAWKLRNCGFSVDRDVFNAVWKLCLKKDVNVDEILYVLLNGGELSCARVVLSSKTWEWKKWFLFSTGFEEKLSMGLSDKELFVCLELFLVDFKEEGMGIFRSDAWDILGEFSKYIRTGCLKKVVREMQVKIALQSRQIVG